MKIIRHRLYGRKTLFAGLRKVTLENSSVLIYENANFDLVASDPDDLFPCQYYVLKGELEKIAFLRSLLLEKGIDILSLDGYLRFWTDEKATSVVDILPPIVEESTTRRGEKVPIICDGLHRVYLTRKLGLKVNIVLIVDLPQEYPYYAYPNKNRWNDIVEIDNLPEGFIKKDYRVKKHRNLFRDFNSAFFNVGRRRMYGQIFEFKPSFKYV